MKIIRSLSLFLIPATFVALTSVAHAQATRTWVSGVGDDANPCSRTAPCKTFAGAISKTAPGGEIDALDPAGFGGITINKAITIDGGGGQVGGILVSGSPGVIVNAGASDAVILRNLRITGVGTGTHGINFIAGKSLSVDHCQIERFINTGINFLPAVQSSLFVANTMIEKIAGTGITASTNSGVNRISMVNSQIVNSGLGLKSGVNTEVTLKECVISNNSGGGVLADGNSLALLTVDKSLITNNDTSTLR